MELLVDLNRLKLQKKTRASLVIMNQQTNFAEIRDIRWEGLMIPPCLPNTWEDSLVAILVEISKQTGAIRYDEIELHAISSVPSGFEPLPFGQTVDISVGKAVLLLRDSISSTCPCLAHVQRVLQEGRQYLLWKIDKNNSEYFNRSSV